MFRLISLAGRNFWRNLSRYRILIISIVVAVTAMVMVIGALQGIIQSVEQKARRYFAGDIAVQEYQEGWRSRISDPSLVERSFEDAALQPQAVSPRMVFFDNNPSIFFNGDYARQRRLMGVDWENEHPVLSELSIIEGIVPEGEDPDGILISTATASRLGARTGDSVVLTLNTRQGQISSYSLIIRAIFDESSFFGYSAYLQRDILNAITGEAPEHAYEMGVFLDSPGQTGRAIRILQQELEAAGKTVAVVRSREQRDEMLRTRDPGEGFVAILTLDAQLAELKDLVDALGLVAAAVILLFMLIVIIGVSNSYSMIVFERTREIGTLRAIGLTKEKTVIVFLLEAAFLGVTSVVIGTFTGIGILAAIGRWADISFAGVTSLFLVQGRLAWYVPFRWVILITLVAVGSSLAGALKPSMKASAMSPVDALRQD
jgi:putative ABC transport system permease protein